MKPLKDLKKFLDRFCHFVDSEIREIKIVDASTILVTLTAQDSARDFDWVSVELEFNGVEDAKLLDNSKLGFVDMEDGITIASDEDRYSFGVGRYSSIASIKNSSCYIECLNIKYGEGLF